MEEDSYQVVPDKPTVTFLDASTTLDYVVYPPGARLSLDKWYVDKTMNCQHLPVLVDFVLLVDHSPPSATLIPRQPNLRYTKDAILAIRELLLVCLEGLDGLPATQVIYEGILNSFVMCGYEGRSRSINWFIVVALCSRRAAANLKGFREQCAILGTRMGGRSSNFFRHGGHFV